jgi:hypothetical protein
MILVRNLLAEAAILLYIGTKKEHQEKRAGAYRALQANTALG